MSMYMEQEEKEERELVSLIPEIVALLSGILSAIFIAIPISYLFNVIPNIQVIGPIFIAPLVEEPSKMIGVLILALYFPDAIDSKKRGLILGVMAGIGFAFTENLMYFIAAPQAIILRAIVPVLLHMCASATAGLGVALLSKRVSRSLRGSARLKQINNSEFKAFLAIAMVFHFLNNLILMINVVETVWAVSIVVDYLILYKLYYYLPDKLTEIKIDNAHRLFISAITTKRRKHDHQTTIADFSK
jgi:RsiW-degrading membrane proteinase PrsW (M82 family)